MFGGVYADFVRGEGFIPGVVTVVHLVKMNGFILERKVIVSMDLDIGGIWDTLGDIYI